MKATTLFDNYTTSPNTWDEMYDQINVRDPYKKVFDFISTIPATELNKSEELARRLFMSQGVTFTVYSSGEGIEKFSRLTLFQESLPAWNGALLNRESVSGFGH